MGAMPSPPPCKPPSHLRPGVWSSSINLFKEELLKSIRQKPTFTYNIHDTKQFKISYKFAASTQLFRRSQIQKQLSRLYLLCVLVVHSSLPHTLPQSSSCKENPLPQDKSSNCGNISKQSDSVITKTLLFGDNKLDFETNKILLMSTIEFISLTERFSCPLIK